MKTIRHSISIRWSIDEEKIEKMQKDAVLIHRFMEKKSQIDITLVFQQISMSSATINRTN